MKLKFLRFNAASMPSPISEGATDNQIVFTLQGIKPDNMTLERHKDTTSGHISRCDQGDDQGPPHRSACLPHDTAMSIQGWPMHYPNVHPLGLVG
jgi:hypothetical protein